MKKHEIYSLAQLNVKFLEFQRYGNSKDALEDAELKELWLYYRNLKDALEPVQSVHTNSGASFHLAMNDTEDRLRIMETWMGSRNMLDKQFAIR